MRSPRQAWSFLLILVAILAMFSTGSVFAAAQDTSDVNLEDLTGTIESDGSSTVGPLTAAVAEEFNAEAEDVEIVVEQSGTGGGFVNFCEGETDLQNASRPIDEDEVAQCQENGVSYFVFEVAFDGITIVVNEENDFVECLTVEQLNQLWRADDPATAWADLNGDYPDDEIALYGPGTDSGTFDYFVETVLGEDGEIRQDFTPSEDDNVLVEGVGGDENALGYFGYSYFAENEDSLNAVAVDAGDGNCIEPSPETIGDGSYTPLSRPLYVYVSGESLTRPEIQEFMRFYLTNATALAPDTGYVAAPEEAYQADLTKLEGAISGEAQPDGPATPAA